MSTARGEPYQETRVARFGRVGTGVGNPFVGVQLTAGVALGLAYLAVTATANDRAALILAGAAALIGLVWPTAGLATLALILPMREPDVFQPFYVVAVILGATSLGCLLRLPGDRRPLTVSPAVVLAMGYGVYTVLSVVPAISGHPIAWAPTAGLEALRLLTGIGLFLVASYQFRSVPVMPIIAIALFGASMAAVLALMGFWKVGPLASLGGLVPVVIGGRASGGFSNANYLGFLAVQGTLLAIGCMSVAQPRYRPLVALALALLVATTVLTFSRSAYLGTVAGIAVLTFLRSPVAAILLVILAVFAATVLYPTFLEARLGGSDILDPATIVERAQSENWRSLAAAAGITMFLAHPIFGVGYGVFQQLSPAFIGASPATYSHDAYIQILAEQGIVGVLMVAGILASLAVGLIRSTHPLRAAALAMGSAYLVQSFFINSTTSIQISGLLVLTMAAALSAVPRLPTGRTQET